jgi:hypothetical protein
VAVGGFTVGDAAPPDTVELLTLPEALRDYPQVRVDAATAALVANGRSLPSFDGSGPWAVVGPQADLLAVYEATDDHRARPAVVIPRD